MYAKVPYLVRFWFCVGTVLDKKWGKFSEKVRLILGEKKGTVLDKFRDGLGNHLYRNKHNISFIQRIIIIIYLFIEF